MRILSLTFAAIMVFAAPLRAEVAIQEVTSPGGINAWLVEEHSIPFTAIEIWFRGGASVEPADKRGVTNLMVGLLEEGAADLDSRGFAEAAETLAASFSYDVYDDTLTVSARFLTENRDDAVALLRTSLMEPRFDEDAVERVREQVFSIIRGNAKDPNDIAGAEFGRLAWGDHPYGSSSDGTLETVAAITRDDLFAAKADVMTRERLYVGAVGDITADELAALLDDLLGELPATGAPLPPVAEVTLPEGGVTVVPFDTPQSVAIFGHAGIDRDDPDFFAAYVLNQILGGSGFSARLMEEVREKRGLTYGVSSYLVPKMQGALIMGQVASANDRVAEAMDVIRAEWARMADHGVTEQELQDAKTYLTGAYPLRFDGNDTIAGIMVGMQAQGLPVDYIATRNDQVNAVTMEDVKRVAKRVLHPEALHFVIVGQPQGLD